MTVANVEELLSTAHVNLAEIVDSLARAVSLHKARSVMDELDIDTTAVDESIGEHLVAIHEAANKLLPRLSRREASRVAPEPDEIRRAMAWAFTAPENPDDVDSDEHKRNFEGLRGQVGGSVMSRYAYFGRRKRPVPANQNHHPYLRPEQFTDRTFLRVRRQVARLRLQTADDPRLVAALYESIRIYDELLDR